MSEDENEEELGFELGIPFVLCTSKGGDLDDQSFVYGYLCGMIAAEMSVAAALRDNSQIFGAPSARYVQTVVIPQLDLIAMRYGFTLMHEPSDDVDGWSWVGFNLATLDLEETE